MDININKEENYKQIDNKIIKKTSKLPLLSLVFALIGLFCFVYYLIFYECTVQSMSGFAAAIILTSYISIFISLLLGFISLFFICKKRKITGIIYLICSFLVLLLFYYIFTTVSTAGHCGPPMDVSIKAALTNLRAAGELYADSHSDIYRGFCRTEDVERTSDSIEAIKKRRKAEKGISFVCNDSDNAWAACAGLLQEKDNYFCVDSSGKAQTVQGKCDENWKYTRCPL